jgi:hypothetical protein
MAKNSTAKTEETSGTVSIKPKKPINWMKLIQDAEEDHWHTLRVIIKLREWLLAGKPASLDAAKAMVEAKAKKMKIAPTVEAIREKKAAETSEEDKEKMVEEFKDEGICEFHRRPDHEGIWLPANNIKAGLKENWTACGYAKKKAGSRSRLAELTFVWGVPAEPGAPVEHDWIYLGEAPHPEIHTAVAHTSGPSGPVSSIKRHEYIVGTTILFDIVMADRAFKELPPELLADTLVHFSEHGLGACRSQGFGKFDILGMEEIDPNAGL